MENGVQRFIPLIRQSKSERYPSRLTRQQRDDLQSTLPGSPEEIGYNTATWSGPLVRDYVMKQYQVEYRQANIYNLLHDLGFSYQRTNRMLLVGLKMSLA
jgi:transposase